MGEQDVRHGVAAPLEIARVAALAADDKKATDILVLDLSGLSDVCDYFLICTAQNRLGAKGEIHALGIRYMRIIFLGSVFVNFAQSANMVMRGEGLMKKAMMIMGLGALINIVLDPILIWK